MRVSMEEDRPGTARSKETMASASRPSKKACRSWIPAFAGMTDGESIPFFVIPAKAGIQGAGHWDFFQQAARTRKRRGPGLVPCRIDAGSIAAVNPPPCRGRLGGGEPSRPPSPNPSPRGGGLLQDQGNKAPRIPHGLQRRRGKTAQRGLTLIELLLAMTVLVLVIGSITASLFAATNALETSQKSLEVYQTARAGLNQIAKDLRKCLSPFSIPYEERLKEEEIVEDPYFRDDFDEEEGLQITFRGSSSDVEFAIRQVMSAEDGPTLDIREVRYRLDDEGCAVKEIYRSLLIARLEDTLAQRLEFRNGEGAYLPEMTGGMFDDPKPQVICEGVRELKFAYTDGVEWMDSWDSDDWVVKDYATEWDDETLTEEDVELTGLPQLVRVDMTLDNGVTLQTVTDIPASELNVLPPRAAGGAPGTLFSASLEQEKSGWERSRSQGYARGRGSRSSSRREAPYNLWRNPWARAFAGGGYGGGGAAGGGGSSGDRNETRFNR